jgi:hypothetical protein
MHFHQYMSGVLLNHETTNSNATRTCTVESVSTDTLPTHTTHAEYDTGADADVDTDANDIGNNVICASDDSDVENSCDNNCASDDSDVENSCDNNCASDDDANDDTDSACEGVHAIGDNNATADRHGMHGMHDNAFHNSRIYFYHVNDSEDTDTCDDPINNSDIYGNTFCNSRIYFYPNDECTPKITCATALWVVVVTFIIIAPSISAICNQFF